MFLQYFYSNEGCTFVKSQLVKEFVKEFVKSATVCELLNISTCMIVFYNEVTIVTGFWKTN